MSNPDTELPKSVDALIVGTGAAGMSAAIRLHYLGLRPVLIEKTDVFGGSTAVSGGAVWIPNNRHSAGVGHEDSLEEARRYLNAEIGNRMNGALVDAFLDNGPKMVEFLEDNSEVKFAARALGPDYHPDKPGGTLGGRVMDPLDYDARKLGTALARLRHPIKEFTVLGGMMVGRTDLGQLPKMHRDIRAFAYATKVVARHLVDLVRFRRGTRSVLGNALAARLGATVHRLGIPIYYNCALVDLDYDGDRIVAASVSQNSAPYKIAIKHGVILAAGGVPQDTELRKKLMPHTADFNHYSMSPEGNSGDTLRIAQELGAQQGQDNLHPAFWAPVSRLKRKDGSTVAFPHLFLDRAKPGVIAVTGRGQRFVNESASYHDFVAGMLDAISSGDDRFYLICDHKFIRRYGLGAVRPFPGRIAPFLRNGYLESAPSLTALARRITVEPRALVDTVSQYNEDAIAGTDRAFGKGGTDYNRYLGDPENQPNPCLRPLGKGPFYGLQIHTGDIGAAAGIVTDAKARVMGANGEPINGLYTAGNDMNSIMCGSYPGPGITLGPALTFGYVAANHVAEIANKS